MSDYTQRMLKQFRQELQVLEGEQTALKSQLSLVNSKIMVLKRKIETYERGNKLAIASEERDEREAHMGSFPEDDTGKNMGIEVPAVEEKTGMFGHKPTSEKRWFWGGKQTRKRKRIAKKVYLK